MKGALAFLVFLLLCLLLFGRSSFGAQFKGDLSQRQTISLELDNRDVREALEQLFGQAKTRFRIDPSGRGNVTIHIKPTSFKAALQAVVGQVNATYRVEQGLYVVVGRTPVAPHLPGDRGPRPGGSAGPGGRYS